MKKQMLFFILASCLWIAFAVLAGLVFFEWKYVIISIGFAVLVLWVLYFRSVKYEITDKAISISSGILFAREHILPLDEINMVLKFSLGGKLLFTEIFHCGGRLFVFADVPFLE